MASLDEYGRDEGTLVLPVGCTSVRLASGRPAAPMVKLAELQGKDTRMGRSTAA